jgi:hypothetical protein
MILPGREIRPAYIALSVGAFLTFVFISLVSVRDPSHLKASVASLKEKVHQYKYVFTLSCSTIYLFWEVYH